MRSIVYLGNIWEYPLAIAAIPGVRLAAILYEDSGDADRALDVSRRTGARIYRVMDDGEIGLALEAIGPIDLGIIANFGIILSPDSMVRANRGFINCHPGLLPEQKGREPVSRLWKVGGGASGLTIHAVEHSVDSGKVLAVAPHWIDPQMTLDASIHRLYLAGLPFLIERIPACFDAII